MLLDAPTIVALAGLVGLPSILSSLVLRRIKKHDLAEEQHSKAVQEESIVVLHNIQAIGHLAEATAENQKLGHVDGKTDTALQYYSMAKNELNQYLIKQATVPNHGS